MLVVYIVPSILALVLKSTILISGRHSLRHSNSWLLTFFLSLVVLNVLELVGFYFVLYPEEGLFWLKTYYCFIIIAFFSLLLFSLQIVKHDSIAIKSILLLCFCVFTTPLLIPNAALLGVKSIGYSITRIAGPYYYLVQLGLL